MAKGNPNLKLKAAIINSGKQLSEVAELIDMPYSSFSRKINGHQDFTEPEIEDICNVLKKNPTDIFFTNLVTECTTKTA